MNKINDKCFKQKEMVYVLLNKPFEDLKQYFIKSEITDNELYSDLQFNINHAFIVAANNGKFNLVKYLLTSPELEMHADINFKDNEAMYSACCNGYQFLVEYLSSSPDLKEHAKIPSNPNELEDIFNSLCDYIMDVNDRINEDDCDTNSIRGRTYYSQLDDYYQVLHYLIYKCEIRPTKDIISILQNKTTKEFYEPGIEKLKLNEMVQSLQDELSHNTVEKKKLKL